MTTVLRFVEQNASAQIEPRKGRLPRNGQRFRALVWWARSEIEPRRGGCAVSPGRSAAGVPDSRFCCANWGGQAESWVRWETEPESLGDDRVLHTDPSAQRSVQTIKLSSRGALQGDEGSAVRWRRQNCAKARLSEPAEKLGPNRGRHRSRGEATKLCSLFRRWNMLQESECRRHGISKPSTEPQPGWAGGVLGTVGKFSESRSDDRVS